MILYQLHKEKRISLPPPAVKDLLQSYMTKVKAGASAQELKEDLLQRIGGNISDLSYLGVAMAKFSAEGKIIAAQILQVASDEGDMNAQFLKAQIAGKDQGLAEIRSLAARGHKQSQYYIGVHMFKDANPRVQKEAVEWIRKAADAGLRDAAAQLGNLYELGVGVGRDPGMAARYYEKAHEQDVVEATFKLGTLYASGHADATTKPNMQKAFELYQQAADKGLSIAQHNLAALHLSGIPPNPASADPNFSLPKSPLTAVEYFKMAAGQGLQLSEMNLGKMYAESFKVDGKTIVPKDLMESRKWLKSCARRGGPIGQEAGRLLKSVEKEIVETPGVASRCSIM
ncbi:hypothetical protein HK097_003266 [Rhizophlyctis rosea]|uniref:HCP-like protein n=1 Tax=Rhizophlyctis rosea TaxID=64517 RepID=A0AAD5S3T9_9FUNG|nr:hypothetical protein HK097_003266 [Rhizophlyctis rosea]